MVYVPLDWQTAPYKQYTVYMEVGMIITCMTDYEITKRIVEALKCYCFFELYEIAFLRNSSALFDVCPFTIKN